MIDLNSNSTVIKNTYIQQHWVVCVNIDRQPSFMLRGTWFFIKFVSCVYFTRFIFFLWCHGYTSRWQLINYHSSVHRDRHLFLRGDNLETEGLGSWFLQAEVVASAVHRQFSSEATLLARPCISEVTQDLKTLHILYKTRLKFMSGYWNEKLFIKH